MLNSRSRKIYDQDFHIDIIRGSNMPAIGRFRTFRYASIAKNPGSASIRASQRCTAG